jgi:hypothetical protein
MTSSAAGAASCQVVEPVDGPAGGGASAPTERIRQLTAVHRAVAQVDSSGLDSYGHRLQVPHSPRQPVTHPASDAPATPRTRGNSMTATDHQSVTNTRPADGVVSPAIKATGPVFAAWYLGFAAVNAWQLASGRLPDDKFDDYSTVLTVMSVLVLLLKLLGAGMALTSLRTVHHRGSAGCWAQRCGRPPAHWRCTPPATWSSPSVPSPGCSNPAQRGRRPAASPSERSPTCCSSSLAPRCSPR